MVDLITVIFFFLMFKYQYSKIRHKFDSTIFLNKLGIKPLLPIELQKLFKCYFERRQHIFNSFPCESLIDPFYLMLRKTTLSY